MAIFLVAALLGLATFFIAIISRPTVPDTHSGARDFLDEKPAPRHRPATPGDLVQPLAAAFDRFETPLVRWVVAVLVCSGVITIAVLWLVWNALQHAHAPQTPFLDYIGSRHLGTLFFGFLFGVLLGYWLSSVFHRKPGEPASYPEIVSSVMMAILLITALLGQDVLSVLVSRMTSFELGGAKLAFSGAADRTAPVSLVQGRGENGKPSLRPPDQSTGLSMLASLPRYIERDADYIRYDERARGDKKDRKSTRLNSSHVALSRMPSSA